MVGRFVTGIGTGIETSTVPMYQAELCEASKRGKLVCSEPLLVGVGIVVRYHTFSPCCTTYSHNLQLLFRLRNELCRGPNCLEIAHRVSDALWIR